MKHNRNIAISRKQEAAKRYRCEVDYEGRAEILRLQESCESLQKNEVDKEI